MSDVKLPEHIDIIKNDAIINMNVSGEFYKRIRKLFDDYCKTKTPEELKAALDKIKNKVIGKDDYAYNIETMLILIAQIEKDGMVQDKISKAPFPKG